VKCDGTSPAGLGQRRGCKGNFSTFEASSNTGGKFDIVMKNLVKLFKSLFKKINLATKTPKDN